MWFAFPAVHGGESFWLLPSRAGVGASAPLPVFLGGGLLEARTCGSGGRRAVLCGAPTLPGRPGAPHLTGEAERAPPYRGGREHPTLPGAGAAARPPGLRRRSRAPAPSHRGVLPAALAPKATTSTSGGPPSSGPRAPCTRAACSSSISPSHRSTPSSLRR